MAMWKYSLSQRKQMKLLGKMKNENLCCENIHPASYPSFRCFISSRNVWSEKQKE